MTTTSDRNASAAPWMATAAYLYTLTLSAKELAWEYLRRNPEYRRDWARHGASQGMGRRWGLRYWP